MSILSSLGNKFDYFCGGCLFASLFCFCSQEIRNQSHECSYKVAKYPENRNRNRYRDVSPCKYQASCDTHDRFVKVYYIQLFKSLFMSWHKQNGPTIAIRRGSCLGVISGCYPHNHFIFLSDSLFTVDHSRVKLENTENDYINASLVVMDEAQRSYILTQVRFQSKTQEVVLSYQSENAGN